MIEPFRHGMRVRVKAGCRHTDLSGKTGTVIRVLRRSAYEAWVRMDDPLPPALVSFPAPDDRHQHICLDADDVFEIENPEYPGDL